MKLLIFFCFPIISLVVSEPSFKYHQQIGIPEASRIKIEETSNEISKIAGGYHTYLGAYSFFGGLIITLSSEWTSVCGSSLITNTKLVTAAHCWFDGSNQAQEIEVVLGSIKLFYGGTRFTTRDVIPHSGFNENLQNDIAIITIDHVNYNDYIQPISLPRETSVTYEGASCKAIGFGRTSQDTPVGLSQQLKHVHLNVLNNDLCATVFGSYVTDTSICTSGEYGKGPCGGDSGGPIIHESGDVKVLIGVISFGSLFGCQAGHPASHTRVTSYIDWIQSRL
ncbi:collagenase-like [Aphomia sociella]